MARLSPRALLPALRALLPALRALLPALRALLPALRALLPALRALLLRGLALFLLHAAARPLAWGDHFWQIRTGLDILDTGALPDREARSYTAAGTRWNNHEWLYEIAAALLWKIGGWGMIRAAVLAWVGGALLLLLWRWRRTPDLAAAAAVATAAAAMYKLNPAPQSLSFLLGVLGWALFARPDLTDRPARLAALGAFCALWGNLSAECLSWIALLLLHQLPAITRPRALPLLLATSLCLLNPPQSSVLEYALAGTSVNRAVNTEFRHLWEPATTLTPSAQIALAAGIAAWLAWGARRVWAEGRWDTAEAMRLLPGVAAILGMILYTRFSSLIWLPLDLFIATLGDATTKARRHEDYTKGTGWIFLLLGSGLGVMVCRDLGWSPGLAVREVREARWWSVHLDPRANPVDCDAALAGLPPGTRVFASRAWGNYLHWIAPQVRVFIDGRNREFPVALHDMAFEVEAGGPRTREILDRSNTQIVLADPAWATRAGLADQWIPLPPPSPTCTLYHRP